MLLFSLPLILSEQWHIILFICARVVVGKWLTLPAQPPTMFSLFWTWSHWSSGSGEWIFVDSWAENANQDTFGYIGDSVSKVVHGCFGRQSLLPVSLAALCAHLYAAALICPRVPSLACFQCVGSAWCANYFSHMGTLVSLQIWLQSCNGYFLSLIDQCHGAQKLTNAPMTSNQQSLLIHLLVGEPSKSVACITQQVRTKLLSCWPCFNNL